jgi:putative transposase
MCWLSASDLASEALPGLPLTRQYCSSWIARVAAQSPDLVRPRAGRGGGLEVCEAALPETARSELTRRNLVAITAGTDEADAHDEARRQIATLTRGHLTERQRRVMDARQTLLLAIEAETLATGAGKDAVIRRLVAEAQAGTVNAAKAAIIHTANDRAGTRCALSRATIYGWFKLRDLGGVAELAPRQVREKSGLPAWFDGFLAHYSRPTKPSIAEALRAFSRELPPGSPLPSEKQARHALRKMPLLARMKGREGKLALRARQAYVARDFSDLLPTSVYVADGKTFDAEIAHPIHGQPFRPELTTIVDVATRRIVGWSAALDESTFAVIDALRRACATAGIPAIFYTDRGPGYRNKAMDAAATGFLARAGITAMRALPYNSQAKGVVERVNQIYGPAARSLPTFIGGEMDKEAKLLAFKATRRDLSLTGTSRLLTGWDAFLDLIEATITAYNDRPHSGLPKFRDPQLGRARHLTPNELWAQKSDGFEPVIPDQAELDDMFRPYVIRRARRCLIEWLGNSYFAPALEAFEGVDVAVGYDIRDASRVWVRNLEEIDGERLPGRLVAIAAFEGHRTRYVPVSAERAALEKRAKGRLARLQGKIGVVEQELRPAALLEWSANATPPQPLAGSGPAQDITPPASPSAAILMIDGRENTSAIPGAGPARRPVFRDDVSFARWLAENPDRATAPDLEHLRDLLTTHSTNELLRMSGVDLIALRKLARSASAHPEHEERTA